MEFIVSRTSKFDIKNESDLGIDINKYKPVKRIIKTKNMMYPRTYYTININSLEELIEFQKKYGEIIITSNMWNKRYKEIEIYDDYRE